MEKQFIDAKKDKLLGDYDTAKERFRQLLKKYPKHDVAAYELADIFKREEDIENALHYVDLALKAGPENRWYLQLKSEVYLLDKNYDGAAEVYESITKVSPQDLVALEKKAWLYAQAKDFERAIEVIQSLEAHIGTTKKTSYIKHDLYKEMGKKNKALEVLEDLVQQYPNSIEYKHVLASYLRNIGKERQAVEQYTAILAIDPEDARANVAMASTFKKEGNEGGYLSSIKPIIESPDADVDIKMAELMPYVRQLQKDVDPELMNIMLDLVSSLEEAHPQEAKVYALHGDLLSLKGSDLDAIEKYRKTLSLDESNYLVWEQLLALQLSVGDMQSVRQSSDEAIELFPNQSMLYYFNGLAAMNLSDFGDAVDDLEMGLMMAGKNQDLKVSIQALLGKAYHELKDYDSSTEAYDNALLLAPADARILNDYSYTLALQGIRLGEAGKMVDKALGMDAKNPRYLATKAWISFRSQELETARSLFEEALKNGGSKYSYIVEKYGDTLFKMGLNERALRAWKEAVEIGGGSKWLQRKIDEEKLIEEQ